MANRRKFITGLGALAAGSAAAVGTGAFTSVTADRAVTVNIEGDANAYLGLSATNSANGAYTNESGDDGKISINFDDLTGGDDRTVADGGSGVNYRAKTVAEDVFRITNQGTQGAEIDLSSAGNSGTTTINTSVPPSGSDLDLDDTDEGVYIYFKDDVTGYVDANTVELGTGKTAEVDVAVITSPDASFTNLDGLTLTGEAADYGNGSDD